MTAPLTRLKILDFSTLLPGPYATMMLADLGADVIRVEAPGRTDLTRILPPFDSDGNSAGHAHLNRNKRNLALNLKSAEAQPIIQKLILDEGYDIIVEQSRPGVMARLGFGYDAIRETCPSIIYCSLTGYGQTGPLRDRAGHDLNYLALSGMLAHYGRADDVPPPLPTQVADIGGGSLHLVIGLLSAVIRRMATGEGAHVDISMHDGALAWNGMAATQQLIGRQPPQRESLPLNGGTFYDLYETSDGELLSVGPLEPKFWQQFCTAIGRPDIFPRGLNFDLANQQALKDDLRVVLRSRTLAEWTPIFEQIDACVEPVLTTADALAHPQTTAREMVVNVPMHNGDTQQQVGTPIKMTNFSADYRHTGTALGANSAEILTQLGYTTEQIESLAKDNTIAMPD